MKKLLLITGLFLLSAQSLPAALSPLNQSIHELKAILRDSRLAESLGQSEPIRSIEATGNEYIFTTDSKQLVVEITYQTPKRIGPREFSLFFNLPQSVK